jgi:hypothetical protein
MILMKYKTILGLAVLFVACFVPERLVAQTITMVFVKGGYLLAGE